MTTMASAASGLRRQLDTLRASPAYRNYVLVKDHVLRLKTLESTTAAGDAPSAYWREELDNIRYMLDASPLIVEQLRRHTQHVTGLRVHDYRSNRDGAKARFADKLEAWLCCCRSQHRPTRIVVCFIWIRKTLDRSRSLSTPATCSKAKGRSRFFPPMSPRR